MPFVNAAIKAAKTIRKGVQTYKAGQAAQKKPAPRPAVVKQPVAVVPPVKKPVMVPKTGPDYFDILGMKVPKPVAYVGGTFLAGAALFGIAKAVR